MIHKCAVCDAEYNFNDDIQGAAIMMAFAHGHSSTWTNISICPHCYKEFVRDALIELNNSAGLELNLSEDDEK